MAYLQNGSFRALHRILNESTNSKVNTLFDVSLTQKVQVMIIFGLIIIIEDEKTYIFL